MISMIFSMLQIIFSLLKYPLYLVLSFFAAFLFSVCVNVVVQLAKGNRIAKGERRVQKKKGFFRRIFIDTPHQFVIDMFEREPDFFPYQGLIIFEGRQGAGKTISMVEFAMRMQNECPKSKVITNLAYKYENHKLKDWRMLMNYKNGHHGVIVAMDELQNWFSSNDSKNFPPEMLRCHNAKQEKSTNYSRYVSKFLSISKSYTFPSNGSATLHDVAWVLDYCKAF